MLVDVYVEALLVDEELADWVWELWDSGLIPDELATIGEKRSFKDMIMMDILGHGR